VQGAGANSSVELTGARVAAPLEAAWDSIRIGLRRDLGARTFDGWLKPAELGKFEPDSGALDIVMPSQFMADWVRSHFGERLTLAWKTVLPVVREVRVIAAADAPDDYAELLEDAGIKTQERAPMTPIVKLVNSLLSQAVTQGASDIHFEAEQREMRVRVRVDGVLSEITRVAGLSS